MENEQTLTETPAPDAGRPAPADQLEAADAAEALAAVTAERDQLAAEKAELLDRFLRRAAEFENFRRRSERERAEIAGFAAGEIVRELLPVLDDFERALKVQSTDKEYAQGIELIHQRLLEVLTKSGLEPVAAEGRRFDPHLHDAVETAPSEELEDQTILEEKRRGYNFRGRPLRPAMVKVAVRA